MIAPLAPLGSVVAGAPLAPPSVSAWGMVSTVGAEPATTYVRQGGPTAAVVDCAIPFPRPGISRLLWVARDVRAPSLIFGLGSLLRIYVDEAPVFDWTLGLGTSYYVFPVPVAGSRVEFELVLNAPETCAIAVTPYGTP